MPENFFRIVIAHPINEWFKPFIPKSIFSGYTFTFRFNYTKDLTRKMIFLGVVLVWVQLFRMIGTSYLRPLTVTFCRVLGEILEGVGRLSLFLPTILQGLSLIVYSPWLPLKRKICSFTSMLQMNHYLLAT